MRAARASIEAAPIPGVGEAVSFVEDPLRTLERHAEEASRRAEIAEEWEVLLNWILYALTAHNQALRGDAHVRAEELQRRLYVALASSKMSARSETIGFLARLRYLLGQHALLAEESPREFERIEDPVQRGKAWIWLLTAFTEQRDLARALLLLERFEDLRDERMSPRELLEYETLHSLILALSGALDRSAEVWVAAEQRWSALGSAFDPSLVQCARMDWLLACEQYDLAIDEARAILTRPSAAGTEKERAQLGLAIAHARSGRDEEALEALAPLEQSESSYGRRARGERSLLALRSGDVTAARSWVNSLERTDALDDPLLLPLAWLAVDDHRRGEGTIAALGEMEARLRSSYESMLRVWDSLPIDQCGHAFLQLGVRRDLLSALFAVILARSPGSAGVEACLDLLLEAEARGSTARSLSLPVRRFRELRDQLVSSDRVLLVYLPALSVSWCIAVSQQESIAARLDSDIDLRKIARELRERMYDAGVAAIDDRWSALAERASAWCFPSAIRAMIDAKVELAIVGGELLQPLPLGSLPWRGVSLGCAKAMMDLPSLSLAASYDRRALMPRDLDLSVLAATTLDARDVDTYGVTPVPVSTPELSAMGSGIAADRLAILAPTHRDDLLSGPGVRSTVTICFAHGVLVDTPRETDVVVLGRSDPEVVGAIGPSDVKGAPDLLLLMTCNSASARVLRGEDGGQRLVGSFLRSGARAVIAADGPLELSVAIFLARSVVRELLSGVSIAEALRRAKLETESQPSWSHPRICSHVRLIGDGGFRLSIRSEDRSEGNPWIRWVLWGGIALVVLVGALTWKRRRNRSQEISAAPVPPRPPAES